MSADDVILFDAEDQVIAVTVPTISPDAPEHVREGAARRFATLTEGRCPCGAELIVPSRRERRAARRAGRIAETWVQHRPGCPAPDSPWGDRR